MLQAYEIDSFEGLSDDTRGLWSWGDEAEADAVDPFCGQFSMFLPTARGRDFESWGGRVRGKTEPWFTASGYSLDTYQHVCGAFRVPAAELDHRGRYEEPDTTAFLRIDVIDGAVSRPSTVTGLIALHDRDFDVRKAFGGSDRFDYPVWGRWANAIRADGTWQHSCFPLASAVRNALAGPSAMMQEPRVVRIAFDSPWSSSTEQDQERQRGLPRFVGGPLWVDEFSVVAGGPMNVT